MAAIYKREMHSYLTSAVGYVFLAVFFAISGYYFFATSLVSNSTDLSYVFSNLFSIAICSAKNESRGPSSFCLRRRCVLPAWCWGNFLPA